MAKVLRWVRWIVGFAAVVAAWPAQANLYELFAKKYDLDPFLIKAVAWVESKGHPWTINLDGLPFTFASKQDAVSFVRDRQSSPWYVASNPEGRTRYAWFSSRTDAERYVIALRRLHGYRVRIEMAAVNSVNVDIGLMQINWRWHGDRTGFSMEELFDPVFNMDYACRLLADLMRTHGTWEGIAKYHSNRPVNQAIYTRKIWQAYRGLVVDAERRSPKAKAARPLPVTQERRS